MPNLSIPIVRKMLLKAGIPNSEESVYVGRYSVGFRMEWRTSPRVLVVTWNYDFTDTEAKGNPEVALDRRRSGLYRCEDKLSERFEVATGFENGQPILFVKRKASVGVPFPADDPRMQDLHDDSPQGLEDA